LETKQPHRSIHWNLIKWAWGQNCSYVGW